MKILSIILNACTVVMLLAALKIRTETFHILGTGEGFPAGFPRQYFEDDGSRRLLIIGLVASIAALIISIVKKKIVHVNYLLSRIGLRTAIDLVKY